MLTDEKKADLKQAIEQAFLPLRCIAKFDDYDQVISFKVLAPNGDVIQEMKDMNVENAKNIAYLKSVLDSVRLALTKKGF